MSDKDIGWQGVKMEHLLGPEREASLDWLCGHTNSGMCNECGLRYKRELADTQKRLKLAEGVVKAAREAELRLEEEKAEKERRRSVEKALDDAWERNR